MHVPKDFRIQEYKLRFILKLNITKPFSPLNQIVTNIGVNNVMDVISINLFYVQKLKIRLKLIILIIIGSKLMDRREEFHNFQIQNTSYFLILYNKIFG